MSGPQFAVVPPDESLVRAQAHAVVDHLANTAATPTFAQPGADKNDAIAGELAHFIRDASDNAARSLQKSIGPSEAGVPCDRRLAYKLLDWPKAQGGGDPLASIIGTGFHAWAAEAFSRPELGGRFLVEQRVNIAPGIIPGGDCDLYDTLHERVLDWKVVGKTSYDRYRSEGPRPQYVTQAHLYGLGYRLTYGRTPREVAIVVVPRQSARLSDLWVWTAPFDLMAAVRAVNRVATLQSLLCAIDPEKQPANWALIPTEPSHECVYCPWYRPGSKNLGDGCPGNLPPTT